VLTAPVSYGPSVSTIPQLIFRVSGTSNSFDFWLSPRRNVALAKAFFRKELGSQRQSPETITLDGYAASRWAVRELREQGRLPDLMKVRSSKYLNNLIKQDHLNVKSRPGAMLSLKNFACALRTIRGIELMHRMCKGQFDLRGFAAQGQTIKWTRQSRHSAG
jgi:transposase-like protein